MAEMTEEQKEAFIDEHSEDALAAGCLGSIVVGSLSGSIALIVGVIHFGFGPGTALCLALGFFVVGAMAGFLPAAFAWSLRLKREFLARQTRQTPAKGGEHA